jgi:hypothetical protein
MRQAFNVVQTLQLNLPLLRVFEGCPNNPSPILGPGWANHQKETHRVPADLEFES